MKKFSKVLLILLAVVALMTALAVTALAADAEEETVTRGEPYVVDVTWSSNNYENPDDFEAHVERGYVKNVSTKAGIYLPAKSIDGNRYVILAHDGLTTTSGGYENITSSGLGSKKYNVESYPYMSFDMDVMTPDAVNGYQLTASVTPRFYGAYGDHGNTTGAKVSIGTLNLPATAYEWHHVTIVYKFGIKTVELNKIPVLEYSGYVDGNLVIEKTEIELTGTAWNYYVNFDSNGALNKGVSKLGDCSSVYLGAMVFYATETLNPNDGKTAIDNFKMSAFPEGYTEDEIANYYNKDGGYQPPFGQHIATITDANGVPTYYDDINKAIKAANVGETIQLATDVSGTVVVDKAITIDTNKYDANGAATGTFYTINCTSNAMAPSTANGKITFTSAGEKTTFVYWDLCMTCMTDGCSHDGKDCTCTCGATVPGHKMYLDTVAVLGTNVVYGGEIPTFEMKDGVATTFVGWSRTLGGKVEELTITEDDIANGWVAFYPVYDSVTYTFEVTTSAGIKSYHKADEFASLFTTVSSGSTIKLLRDLDTNVGTIEFSVKKTITLDLNGYDIRRCYVYGTSYKYVNGDTTDEVIETVSAGNYNLFSVNTVTGVNFTVTSSRPGSDFHITALNANTWYNEDGTIAKREGVETNYSRFIYINKATTTVNINNVSLYATSFIYDGHATLKNVNVTINDAYLYRIIRSDKTVKNDQAAFYFCTKYGNLTVSNTKIFDGASKEGTYFLYTKSAQTNMQGSIIFTDCDIIFTNKIGNASYYFATESESETHRYEFVNCRLYRVKTTDTLGPYLSDGTYVTEDALKVIRLETGLSAKSVRHNITYTIPASFAYAIDEATGYPVFNMETTEFEATFSYKITSAHAVNWYDANGNLVETTYVSNGDTAVGPELTYTIENEFYRKGKYVWGDADGNLANLVIDGSAEEYNFYAYREIDGKVDYAAAINGAQLSLIYYVQFHTVFYLPVVDGMDAPTVSGASKGNVVYINGEAYWSYTYWMSTTTLFNDKTSTVSYTVDGVNYEKKVTFSGLLYAELVLKNADYTNEYASVANMVRYVREALEAASDTTHAAKIEELIGTANADGSTTGGIYSLPAYVTEYENVESNVEALAPYISSLQYNLAGSSINFAMYLTEKAKTDNIRITLTCGSVVPGVYTDADANGNPRKWDYWTAHNIKVYDIIKPMTITITVPGVADAESEDATTADTVITATFSIGAYIEANPDVEVVKALYAFGVSAKAYRESLGG